MPPRRRTTEPIAVTAPAPPKAAAAPLPRPDAPPVPAAEPAAAEQAAVQPAPGKPVFKQRSVYLEETIWERARAAIAYLRYFEIDDEPDTLAALIGQGLLTRIADLEGRYNDGKPFKAARRLPTGPGKAGLKRLSTTGSDDG